MDNTFKVPNTVRKLVKIMFLSLSILHRWLSPLFVIYLCEQVNNSNNVKGKNKLSCKVEVKNNTQLIPSEECFTER